MDAWFAFDHEGRSHSARRESPLKKTGAMDRNRSCFLFYIYLTITQTKSEERLGQPSSTLFDISEN